MLHVWPWGLTEKTLSISNFYCKQAIKDWFSGFEGCKINTQKKTHFDKLSMKCTRWKTRSCLLVEPTARTIPRLWLNNIGVLEALNIKFWSVKKKSRENKNRQQKVKTLEWEFKKDLFICNFFLSPSFFNGSFIISWWASHLWNCSSRLGNFPAVN